MSEWIRYTIERVRSMRASSRSIQPPQSTFVNAAFDPDDVSLVKAALEKADRALSFDAVSRASAASDRDRFVALLG